jgi:hypothetical protein
MSRIRTYLATLSLACSLLATGPVWAQDPSAADKETARNLLISGREKFSQKDFKGAYEAFRAAYDLVKVPTTGLDLARAQEALGLLTEARDTAFEVKRMPEQPKEPEIFKQARTEADVLAEAIGPRIPAITIKITGVAAGTEPLVTIDGAKVPTSALGFARKMNPGDHAVKVVASGYVDHEQRFVLKEGESKDLQFAMRMVTETTPVGAEPEKPTDKPGTPIWAWVSLGVGAGATIGGVGVGITALNAASELQAQCPSERTYPPGDYCVSPEFRKNYEAFNTRRIAAISVSTIGVVGLGVGIVGLVLAKRKTEKPAHALVIPWVSPSNAGVSVVGRF